ncbi:VCBS repeat-containing protein [Antarcticimicrobium luteum]|uniref:VCBS repeat-containing protein n=2 Tax=Antarcticimicrobium luteum TaxID=2547397 RepID=A0A4R5UVG4_9RHOB|nr:VCBS repeat-containing protein [Antarcticimicrobium luteum]
MLCLSLILALPAIARAAPAASACVGAILDARYIDPTDRYPHGALGDPWEWAALSVTFRLTPPCLTGEVGAVVTLPADLVFEDVAPKLADLDGDGTPEILTVESQRDRGARLAVYKYSGGKLRRVATTPHIGQRNRWLAQLGAADLDGDGAIEIAYIDRPHLARTLRIWRYRNGALTPVADAPNLTNHRFGEPGLSGGIRTCAGAEPEIITADANWFRIIASTLRGGAIARRDIGPYTGPESLTDALACR